MTPDVNLLVAAYHQDHAHHDVARAWLNAALQACLSGGRLRLLPMVCTSFVRIVTHAKVFTRPAPPAEAIGFVDALLQSPGCDLLTLGAEWPAFAQLCSARGLGGNAVQDAWIAMAARRHTTHLVTFDRDFARLLDRHEYTLLTPRH